jgi:hypothetical protein
MLWLSIMRWYENTTHHKKAFTSLILCVIPYLNDFNNIPSWKHKNHI